MASPVVSLTSTFSSILNKAYKSATQQKLNRNAKAWFIKTKLRCNRNGGYNGSNPFTSRCSCSPLGDRAKVL